MDRDIPSVLTTLAGVASLTDLLTEMPLPTPLPQVLSNKSLLFHPRVAEEALKLLGVRDDKLVPQLVHSLSQTSADHIELKDHHAGSDMIMQQSESLPELLRAITEKNPNVFNGIQVSSPRPPTWNHTGQSGAYAAGHISPCGTRHTPQGSPASPASARLPSQPPASLVPAPSRPSVITEQQKPPTQPPARNQPQPNCNDTPAYASDYMQKQNNGITEQHPNSAGVNNNFTNISNNKSSENETSDVNYSNVNSASVKTACTDSTENKTSDNTVERDLRDQLQEHLDKTPANIRGPSPAQASDAPAPVPVPFITETPNSDPTTATTRADSNIIQKQPVVRLDRLSLEDQVLMQESLSKFAENRPQLASQLGITATQTQSSDSENEEKTKSRSKKDKKYITDDDYVPDTFTALVGRKRKATNSKEEKQQEIIPIAKPKLRRVERKFVPVLEKLSVEELMETNTYHRFNRSVENILENVNESMLADLASTDDDDVAVQQDVLLNRCQLQDLCTEAAKLKVLGAMEMIPTDRLCRLLSVLEVNVRVADKLSLIADPEENESIRQMWMETAVDRVIGAADASLTCLYIMTSPNMPKRVYLEDVIDRIIMFLKFQLHNTIFPSFDSVYRIESKNKTKESRKKKSSSHATEKSVQILYNKVHELVSLVSELLNIQIMTDTTVLHASSMGVAPFFAENVSELQLSALKLVTTIFTRYEKHRRLLLDDILASIARLPSSKRSLRTYRLNSEEHIQMLTALVLQLIQCVVQIPENLANEQKDQTQNDNSVKQMDKDILICSKYEIATKTAGTFLTVFLNKCGSKTEEIDYRPLFENFVQDLLTTVNKPEWPATELLLSLLGTMLVKNFSNKGTDMSLRVASLDYLGVVAARLRRDTVLSRCKANTIDQMIKDIKSEELKEGDVDTSTKNKKVDADSEEEKNKFLQRVLLDYLAVNAHKDEAHKYARHFYIAQWFKDAVNEKTRLASGEKSNKRNNSRDNHRSRKSKKDNSDDDDDISEDEEVTEKVKNNQNDANNAEIYRIIDTRKKFLINKIRPFQETISSGNRIQVLQTYIDYGSAELISQYLASKRSFSQSFDGYLKTILLVLRETSIAIRTKAMKCLTMIVEADPSVLGIGDMQIGVNHSFLDHSTSVREAAVDLVGKFVLSRPELIDKYYDMLSARILDTGVSVRKRVIKILKDICIECPEFPKIPEICVKMIRRVNDEEGIRKLVMEVFQNMWFTPTPERPMLDRAALLRKVMNITDVVASSKDIGLEWFEQLLVSLFKPKEDKDDSTKVQVEPPKILLLACRQIVDCLIENVLHLEESGMGIGDQGGCSQRLVACLTTLYLFAKIRPQLLVKHASTLQPYLSLKCQTKGDIKIISSVAQTLELVVPLMEHPSETFLAQLEEDSIKLIIQHDRSVISSCLSCLGSIVNNVTRNFKLIIDCFNKYYGNLLKFKDILDNDPLNPLLIKYRPLFRRALFTVGLLLRHFDFTDKEVIGDLAPDIKDQVFQTLIYFLRQDDEDIQSNTLKAIGFICIRHYEFMLDTELKTFYHRMLIDMDAPLKMKTDVLLNIEMYLMEEENRMIKLDLEWAKRSKEENLKEMGDVSSGMASTIIQHYLKEVLTSFIHPDILVRHSALKVIQLILQQGLVHPVQIVPYLICMSTDSEKLVSHSADKQLAEIEKKYPGFIHTKSQLGVRLSYQLQTILQSGEIVRGSRIREQGEYPTALNGYLYSLLRGSRQQRRALVLNMLKQFDEQVRTSLSYMLYLSDNLAYFPYMVQDEPLFIVHQIDIMISVSGTNLLQSFREGLLCNEDQQNQNSMHDGAGDQQNQIQNSIASALDDDDEDEEALVARLPSSTTALQSCITAAQGCLLLLVLKQHLKDIYGLSDGKISQYSPSEVAKVYEKTASRRSNTHFNPKATINRLKQGNPPDVLDNEGRKDLVAQYLDFKQLMMKLDPDDPDEEEATNALKPAPGGVPAGAAPTTPANPTATGSVPSGETDQVTTANLKGDSPQKVPKLIISNRKHESSDHRRSTQRSQKSSSDKSKKHRHKKKRKKFISSSGDESENDFSDPDFMA